MSVNVGTHEQDIIGDRHVNQDREASRNGTTAKRSRILNITSKHAFKYTHVRKINKPEHKLHARRTVSPSVSGMHSANA